MGLYVESMRDMARTLAAFPGDVRRVTQARFAINLAVHCENPVMVPRTARRIERQAERYRDGRMVRQNATLVDHSTVALLDMEVPCRVCAGCRKARAHHWRLRAIVEAAAAQRTWFTTLTLRAEEQSLLTFKADQLARRAKLDLDALPAERQFGLRVRALGPELSAFFKRVRKNSAAHIRFMWVAEMHLGGGIAHGLPHIHALIHEKSDVDVVRKRMLHDAWKLGYSAHKLIAPGETLKRINYLCKYLFKQTKCPVRASNRYGSISAQSLLSGGPSGASTIGEIRDQGKRLETRVAPEGPPDVGIQSGEAAISFAELMRQF